MAQNVNYGSGQVNGKVYPVRVLSDIFTLIPGTEYIDTVTIAPGVTIRQQSIGVASNATGFNPFDGILGCVEPLPFVSAFVSTPFPVVLVPIA
jgi:hypothetical protein